jgi:hypothetical protein
MLGTASPIHQAIGGISFESGCTTTISAGESLPKFGNLGTRRLRMTVDHSSGRWSLLLTGLTSARSNARQVMVEVNLQTDIGKAFFSSFFLLFFAYDT